MTEGKKYNFLEATEALKHYTQMAVSYPQGQPIDIDMTLTDEEWSAVTLALRAMLITHMTEGADIIPDWMADQIHTAMHKISDKCAEVTLAMQGDELIKEIEEELG